jgi:acyl-CoA reductase-like NAD-dependent aldehyde dehydrogenase
VTLELGGKSPNIVFEDAVDGAIEDLRPGRGRRAVQRPGRDRGPGQ